MNFREAELRDAERIATLHAESWRRHYRGMMRDEFLDTEVFENRRRAWREQLGERQREQLVLLAEEGATLAGFISVFGDEDALWGSYIDNLHVAPEHMRCGVGTALTLRAGEWLHGRHPQLSVYLWVMEANARARRFYEHLGAYNVGTRLKLHPGGGYAPNCRYAWRRPADICSAAAACA